MLLDVNATLELSSHMFHATLSCYIYCNKYDSTHKSQVFLFYVIVIMHISD